MARVTGDGFDPANDLRSNNEIFALLADPLYGIGALNAAIQHLDERVGGVDASLQDNRRDILDIRETISQLDLRIPYSPDQAALERRHLLHREMRRRAWHTSLSAMKNKAVEHIGVVLGVTIAGILLGGNLMQHAVTTIERLFHLDF